MGSLSDFAENELLDHIFNAAYTAVATVYLGLATGDPTDAGTGASFNEVANANAYARTSIAFSAAASRKVIQNGDVMFPEATGAWGTITHWAILDNATHGAGNMLAHGALSASIAPVSGNTVTVPSLEVEVEVTASSGAGLGNYAVHNLLDLMFRNQAFAKPATYVGLATATIADTDVADTNITEVAAANGYARKLVNINGGASPTWDLAAAGALDNTHEIVLGPPTGSWGLVTSCFLIDSLSGAGNVLGYDNDNIVDQTPVNGDTVRFQVGAFDVSLS